MTDAEITNYVAVMDSIGATNITVRRCKFTVRSIRAGVMTAAMRFEYKANRKWPYDPTVPAMREATWMLQPLKVQPNRCVATGSSLTSVAAGSFSTFTVFARDQFSNPRILGGELVNALLISKDYTTDAPLQLSADVVNNGNGTYFVEFLLTKTGNYFLAINVIPSGEVAPKQVNDILASSFNVLGSPSVSLSCPAPSISTQSPFWETCSRVSPATFSCTSSEFTMFLATLQAPMSRLSCRSQCCTAPTLLRTLLPAHSRASQLLTSLHWRDRATSC